MIVGRGDIASVLIDRPNVTFFVSGVSNSRETRDSEFTREYELLLDQSRRRHIVYVSTLAVYYGDSPYVEHKRRMEKVVRSSFRSYTIFRIGNITWGKNPHTLINYLRSHPNAEVQLVHRYLIDKAEFLHWVSMAPIGVNSEMNITGKLTWVPDLVKQIRNVQRQVRV